MSEPPQASQTDETSLFELFEILWEGKWWLTGFVALVLCLAGVFLLSHIKNGIWSLFGKRYRAHPRRVATRHHDRGEAVLACPIRVCRSSRRLSSSRLKWRSCRSLRVFRTAATRAWMMSMLCRRCAW